jgi:Na+-translocating ferredoxin:NAD+ oxidoreductase RnfA subunit
MTFLGGLLMLTLFSNVVLDQFLGLCETRVSGRDLTGTALLSAIMTLVALIATTVNWTLFTFVLEPLGIASLSPLFFVLVNLGIVTGFALLAVRAIPAYAALLTDYLFRVGANSLTLGLAIIAANRMATFGGAVAAGLAGGAGFFLVSALLGAIQDQLRIAPVPPAMRGMPITLVTLGLMALAFLAFDQLLLQNLVGSW